MGNETEQPRAHSDETISCESEKKPEGAASVKQPVDGAAANRDERGARMQPSPSPAINFMGWSNSATPIPTTLIGNGGGTDSGGILRPCLPPFWYPGVQNLNQFNLPPIFQCSPLQTDLQQNAGPQYSDHDGLVAIPFIPIFGLGGMLSPSNMFPVMMPMNMGQPLTAEGLAQFGLPGGMTPGTLERAPQGQAGDIHGLQGPPWGGTQGAQRPNIEPQRQANRRFRVGFQLDLLLLLKLAIVVFVFNQDGSKNRLFLLLFLAAIVYMYQTGALAPLLRWFSQSAQRAMMPPQQPEHANNAAQGQRLGGAAMRGAIRGGPEQGEGGNRAQQGLNNMQRPPPPDAGNWWGLFKEMQMLIVGFVTSLLPGYQHAE